MAYNKILIVDDDKIMSKGISLQLQKRGYEVHVVYSIMELFDTFVDKKYDLILLDIKMPDVLGVEGLIELRKKYPKIHLPVIMFSSSDEEEDVIFALKNGANDFVKKPVNIEILVSRINVQLEIKKLSEELVQKEQLTALAAMTVTYNHEINNLLTLSFGRLEKIKGNISQQDFDKLYDTQTRILNVIKKINEAASRGITYTDYSEKIKMINIK